MKGALRSGRVTVNGVTSPYVEAGPEGATEAVVFVHGSPGAARDWSRLVSAVAPHGRAIAFDMPGFAGADKPESFGYTAADYARHLGGALDQAGVQRAHLVLHDFGVAWGLRWAAADPSRAGSLTLFNSGVVPGYRWHSFARMWRVRGLGEVLMALASKSAFRRVANKGVRKKLPRQFVDDVWRGYDRATRRVILKLYRRMPDPAGELNVLPTLVHGHGLPLLIVWGTSDPFISGHFASFQQAMFPRSEVVLLEGSGHWPFVDDPAAVERVVVPFLAARVGPEPPRRRRPVRSPGGA